MYALLLLPEGESGAVRAHLRACALCREELHHVREDLATYALTVEPVALPVGAREQFVGSLPETSAAGVGAVPLDEPSGETPFLDASNGPALGSKPGPNLKSNQKLNQKPELNPELAPNAGHRPAFSLLPAAGPRAGGETGFKSPTLAILGWAGWAAAAAIALVAFGLRQDRNALQSALQTENAQTARLQTEAGRSRQILSALTGPGAVRVNLTTPKAPALPSARATYDPRSGTLLLIASSLRPLPPAKVYELWLIPADGSAPIAAGTFSPDGRGNVSLLLPPLGGARAAKAFGITQENAGGSPTPTLPILLAGAAPS